MGSEYTSGFWQIIHLFRSSHLQMFYGTGIQKINAKSREKPKIWSFFTKERITKLFLKTILLQCAVLCEFHKKISEQSFSGQLLWMTSVDYSLLRRWLSVTTGWFSCIIRSNFWFLCSVLNWRSTRIQGALMQVWNSLFMFVLI